MFVLVDGRAVRASRRSAAWCIEGVEQCWRSKEGRIRPDEKTAARAAWDAARATYRRILEECEGE